MRRYVLRLSSQLRLGWIAFWAAILTSIGILVTLLTNARTLSQNNRYKRAEFLLSTSLQLHSDKVLSKVFDEIQYDKFVFNSKSEAGSDLGTPKEMELVYWLDFLNAISDAVHENLLTVTHLRSCTLGYAIDKTFENSSIRAYLKHVASYDMNRKSDLVSWGLLRRRDHESFTYLRQMARRYKEYEKRMRGPTDLEY